MIFHLPTFLTVTLDIIAWFLIHMGVSYSMSRVPIELFKADSVLCRRKSFEAEGRLYERLFRIKKWKETLPDGATLFKAGFPKRHLKKKIKVYLQTFIKETCRAELTHWLTLACAGVFFIWNHWWIGLIMIVYAAAVNLPCILTQRYNRIRLVRVVAVKSARSD